MRRHLLCMLCLALAAPLVAVAADPEPVTIPTAPVPENTPEPAPPPAVAPPSMTPKTPPKPRAVSKPAAAVTVPEPPKPAEKPQAAAENVTPRNAVTNKPVEAPPPPAVPPPTPATTETELPAATGYSFGCLALAFAMLIIGFAAGFLGRHFLSRHKLGGMTVRIGTWRGIP